MNCYRYQSLQVPQTLADTHSKLEIRLYVYPLLLFPTIMTLEAIFTWRRHRRSVFLSENTSPARQWCAGHATVNKVVDRQNVQSLVNKMTMTLDQPSITGSDLSACIGIASDSRR